MKQKLTKRFIHALLTALLSTGIIMPVLGVMDHSFLTPRVLLLSAVIIVVFEAASLHRIAAMCRCFAGFRQIQTATVRARQRQARAPVCCRQQTTE